MATRKLASTANKPLAREAEPFKTDAKGRIRIYADVPVSVGRALAIAAATAGKPKKTFLAEIITAACK